MGQGPSWASEYTDTDDGAEGVTVAGSSDTDEDPQSWDEVHTNSTSPVADALYEFADEVEEVEQTVDNNARVDVYFDCSHSEQSHSAFATRSHEFTGPTDEDIQRISIEYNVNDA